MRLIVALVLALLTASSCGSTGGISACATGASCVDDKDCASGARCNTALTTPQCETLYCGTGGSTCSASYFCQSKLCSSKHCLEPGATPALGTVTPKTVNYINLDGDGGFVGSILFTDDPRNDCMAVQARAQFGNSALLYLSSDKAFTAGQNFLWLTDREVIGGAARPNASFEQDTLTGEDLRAREGVITLEQVPVGGGSPNVQVHLLSVDAGIDATFNVPPLCP